MYHKWGGGERKRKRENEEALSHLTLYLVVEKKTGKRPALEMNDPKVDILSSRKEQEESGLVLSK